MIAAIKTFGCRLNQSDAAKLAAELATKGIKIGKSNEHADAYIIFSCTVTAKAEQASRRAVRSIRSARPNSLIVFAGCAAKRSDAKNEIEKDGADLVTGLSNADSIASEIAAKLGIAEIPETGPSVPLFRTTRAILKVQDGCGFNCSYCAVRLARGVPRSRPFDEILREARALALLGHKELVLTGANLGCYKDGRIGLEKLLEKIEEIPNISRIRISSIEFSTAEKEIINYISISKKVCRYIHIPLQSGDNEILKLMRRRYSIEQYSDFIREAKSKIPSLGIGTDIIAGFPGENEESFERTCEIVKDLPFSNIHVFPFSPRPGTAAAAMPHQLPASVRKKRARVISEIGLMKRNKFAAGFVGKEVEVLIETIRNGMASGWSGEYLECFFPSRNLKRGDIVKGKVLSFKDDKLFCKKAFDASS